MIAVSGWLEMKTGETLFIVLCTMLPFQPNDEKRSRNFNEPLVRHQARYLGLMENIRVRRAGFAYRQDYKQALARYFSFLAWFAPHHAEKRWTILHIIRVQ